MHLGSPRVHQSWVQVNLYRRSCMYRLISASSRFCHPQYFWMSLLSWCRCPTGHWSPSWSLWVTQGLWCHSFQCGWEHCHSGFIPLEDFRWSSVFLHFQILAQFATPFQLRDTDLAYFVCGFQNYFFFFFPMLMLHLNT